MLENKNVLKEQGDMSKRQRRDFRGGPVVKNLPSNAGDLSLGQEDPLEEEMTTLSSTLAW